MKLPASLTQPKMAGFLRAARFLLFYLPLAYCAAMLGLRVAGDGYADQFDYLIELPAISVWVFAIIGIVAGWMALTGMDLDNKHRRELQDILIDRVPGNKWGAASALACEAIAWLVSLWLIGEMVLRQLKL